VAPSESSKSTQKRKNQTWYIITFILGLSLFASFVLSLVYTVLSPIQEKAKIFDRNKQLLMAAHVLNFDGSFQLYNKGSWQPAIYDKSSHLLELTSEKPSAASSTTIESYVQDFVRPLLTNRKGEIFSFEDAHIDLQEFLEQLQDTPAYNLPYLLFFAILKNSEEARSMTNSQLSSSPEHIQSLVLPISGYGLWGPIDGYLGIANDGNTVLGTSWYDQGETPGLGANIANPEWQKQFYGKKVFLSTSSGTIDYSQAPLGLNVIKGSVQAEFGDSPKAFSAIDGISGATLTCNGVSDAYTQSLAPYRALLSYFATLKASGKK